MGFVRLLLALAVLLSHIPGATMDWSWQSWTAILLALALSAAIMMLVEQPVDRWRQKRAASARERARRPFGTGPVQGVLSAHAQGTDRVA